VWQEKTLKMTELYKNGEISKTWASKRFAGTSNKQIDQFNHTIGRYDKGHKKKTSVPTDTINGWQVEMIDTWQR